MRLKGGRAFELRRGAAPSLHAIALSRRKQGFESPRERQRFQGLNFLTALLASRFSKISPIGDEALRFAPCKIAAQLIVLIAHSNRQARRHCYWLGLKGRPFPKSSALT